MQLLKSLKTGMRELLHSQNYTPENNTNKQQSSNEELIERHTVPGTGFMINGNKQLGYFVSIGTYRVTENQPTIEECNKLITEKDYTLLMGIMYAVIKSVQNAVDAIKENTKN